MPFSPFLNLGCAVYLRAECALTPYIRCDISSRDKRSVMQFPLMPNVPSCNFSPCWTLPLAILSRAERFLVPFSSVLALYHSLPRQTSIMPFPPMQNVVIALQTDRPHWELHNGMQLTEWPGILSYLLTSWMDSHLHYQ